MKEYLTELVRVLAKDIDNNDLSESEALEIIDALIEASQR